MPGLEQFANIRQEVRNPHIAVGMAPLMLLREELVTDNSFQDRGGMDDNTRDHYIQLLVNCDRWRRRITYNPNGEDLGAAIERAASVEEVMDANIKPFGGDDIQMPAQPLYPLHWKFDGTDANLPLNSQLDLPSINAYILLGAIDRAIVAWTRLNSADRGMFITKQDSYRIYGAYQMILEYLQAFGGEDNRVDLAQLRATDEPRGPENAANRLNETVRNKIDG